MALERLFVRQFWALFRKNWIVISKHKAVNLLRCLFLPVAYGVFLAVAQIFLTRPNHFGLGAPTRILSLAEAYDPSLALIWADGTNSSTNSFPSPRDVMSLVVQSLRPDQRNSVREVDSPEAIPNACPQNFNLVSECFVAIEFHNFPRPSNTTGLRDAPPVTFNSTDPLAAPNGTDALLPSSLLNYTIRADAGLGFIDVVRHRSDFERRILPVQWAVDSAIIQIQSGSSGPPPTPLEWPFSMETDKEQALRIRLSYIRGLRSLLVLALFINFLGVTYHLSGSYVTERAAGLTSHLRAMGLRDTPRIVSWHVSISLAYLPGWLATAILWRYRIFSGTSIGLVLVVHLVTGLSLASYSFMITLLPLSPSLSASTSSFLSLIFAVLALVFKNADTGTASIFVLIFPPSFYIFAIRAMAGFEVNQIHASVVKPDPDSGLTLLPLILIALLSVFLYPLLAVWFERLFYDVHDSTISSKHSWLDFWLGDPKIRPTPVLARLTPSQESPAIIIKNLSKSFRTSFLPSLFWPSRWFGKRGSADLEDVTAIADLSLTIPRGGIFVLLGSNGAGKSTVLGVLGGLIGKSHGTVTFPPPDSKRSLMEEGARNQSQGPARPPRGALGIVPQKNVLFPELTCFQTIELWSAIKRPIDKDSPRQAFVESSTDDLERLLVDCGLEGKVHDNAGNLSGGQKRKLQLAIGLVGGSEIVLVDECTSGVDPLSRRSIWRTLTAVKNERTIVFTTHFLDEADLLADNITILSAPGRLVVEGSPVKLKSTLGQGYIINVFFCTGEILAPSSALLPLIQRVAPDVSTSLSFPRAVAYKLHSKDPAVVKEVLDILHKEEERFGISNYDVHGTSIEDIFLELVRDNTEGQDPGDTDKQVFPDPESLPSAPDKLGNNGLGLASGAKLNALGHALVIFYKRMLIARRSWLSPLLTVIIAVAGSCVPLFFMSGRDETCKTALDDSSRIPLYLGNSPYSSFANSQTPGGSALISPPELLETLGVSATTVTVAGVADNQTFIDTIHHKYRNLSLGGVSVDLMSGDALIAWEASPPGLTSLTLLNLASNVLYNRALNASGMAGNQPSIITANYQSLPSVDGGTLFALKWIGFYGLTMGAFPAFFALYVARERRSSVKAMQLSNGLTNPAGLWLGHIMFEGMICVTISTIIITIFATVSDQFKGLGYFWVVLNLYGIAAALFAYSVTFFTASSLAAFAAVAAYQIIIFVLYVAGYLLTVTYAKTSKAAGIITIIHFTVSLVSPVASALRAALVSVNLFSLLCSNGKLSANSMGNIMKYGGPISYLIGYCVVLFIFLVYSDSGSLLPRRAALSRPRVGATHPSNDVKQSADDVSSETAKVETSTTDLLRVLHVSKSFDRTSPKAVDDISFSVSQDTVFAMLGPNGAGKTTIFNIIRGDIYPDSGDVYINGTSIIMHPNTARLSLGVCPQFTAIDPQLTVREHLEIYGLLKGLKRGQELKKNIEILLLATTLDAYADRMANKLSGGNQRKLAFAIALIGNPTVILVDEYSTGIDAATKRSMWKTFRKMAVGKAVVITTHSMEEATALASKVGILSGRMLAVGPTETLAGRYATYEVHFPARSREELVRAQRLMSRIPGSRMADDIATRFEVPIQSHSNSTSATEANLSLAQLFEILSKQNDFPEYTVGRINLESVFLKIIREHNVQEEGVGEHRRKRICCRII